MERTPASEDKSPPQKKKTPSQPFTVESADVFEATSAGTPCEISMLFSTFVEVLRERAAADTAQMRELQGLLTEARNLESYLKEKKRHLRQALAEILDKLQD